MYLIGYDIGTSSVKATLLNADTGKAVTSATSPSKEMAIIASQPGFAEQNPSDWWANVKLATAEMLKSANINTSDVKAIGITYQMHGLVCVDRDQNVIRPSIIWCDSRAVEIGRESANRIGAEICLENMLNLPGNFTAAKLKWVMENEPEAYSKIYKIMVPGDYIAMKMTGEITTTETGLSEGIMWDFKKHGVAQMLLDDLGINNGLIADVVPMFGVQGELNKEAAAELGLTVGTKITYRGGDQPNNALSLNVLEPGDIAATAGTSGVVCGIGDQPNYDSQSRVNSFIHVNHTADRPRYSVLLCVNGAGILNSWLKHNVTGGMDYPEMNSLAGKVPVGSDGLVMMPFGNGSERTLGNENVGASVHCLDFNRHDVSHMLRAAQEGIVFALNFGLGIMRDMGIEAKTVRAGNANMFLSDIFASAFATVTGTVVELYDTDGSQGAARGAGIGAGVYKNSKEAFVGLEKIKTIEPDAKQAKAYEEAYNKWFCILETAL